MVWDLALRAYLRHIGVSVSAAGIADTRQALGMDVGGDDDGEIFRRNGGPVMVEPTELAPSTIVPAILMIIKLVYQFARQVHPADLPAQILDQSVRLVCNAWYRILAAQPLVPEAARTDGASDQIVWDARIPPQQFMKRCWQFACHFQRLDRLAGVCLESLDRHLFYNDILGGNGSPAAGMSWRLGVDNALLLALTNSALAAREGSELFVQITTNLVDRIRADANQNILCALERRWFCMIVLLTIIVRRRQLQLSEKGQGDDTCVNGVLVSQLVSSLVHATTAKDGSLVVGPSAHPPTMYVTKLMMLSVSLGLWPQV
ncbi:hypothetical protein EV182_006758, partial [Spiromyces aspiralis]